MQIYLDFDNTLICNCPLEHAFFRHIPYPAGESAKERLTKRREEAAKYESLTADQRRLFWLDRGGKFIEYHQEIYVAFLRPHAKDFLKACQQLAPTAILTSGLSKFQRKVGFQAGLFDEKMLVYGRDTYAEVPKHINSILVDDLHIATLGVQEKLKSLGLGTLNEDNYYETDRFLKVEAWFNESDDNELLTILPQIEKMI